MPVNWVVDYDFSLGTKLVLLLIMHSKSQVVAGDKEL